MLVHCGEIDKVQDKRQEAVSAREQISHWDAEVTVDECIAEKLVHPDALGTLRSGCNKHFYSAGAFDLIHLLFYLLKQTGPASLFLTTYSISMDSIAALRRKLDGGEVRDVRFLIDNRVRSISPKPFDCLVASFPQQYRCLALHAKVALLYNEKWKISIVGSQNATHNPKLERGIIHTDKDIFDFDYKRLSDEFERCTL